MVALCLEALRMVVLRLALLVVLQIVTCRWHVLLDVSWVRSVASSMEMSVLSSDPEPLLAESFGELTGFLSEIRVFHDDCYDYARKDP
jgi:hypothetical protein